MTEPDSDAIVQEYEYLHPIEAVWTAITDADAISQWLMVTDGFKPEVGAKFTLRQPGADWGNVEGEVLEVDEPNRIRYTWTNGPGFNTTVTLSLESTPSRMIRLGRSEFAVGRQITTEESEASVDAVELEQVHALARDLFARGKMGVCILGPLDDIKLP